MQIFNTLTRQKEEFVPQVPGEYRIYVCGPTVYNYIHIGNARPLIVFDTLRRYLEYRGNKVIYVSNITDIDDKLIKKGQEEGTSMKEVAQRFEAEYLKDAAGLNCEKPTVQPRATEHIPQILDIVKDLIDSGHAYVAKNGDVYFRVKSDPGYGKLSHLKLDDLESGNRELRSRMEDDLKEDPADFAVWKAAKPGEPAWESPYGMGRPGWHIECSAMSRTHLGKTIDLHCGGQDLIFPHHENEIAQSECANGCEFARYWMHNGFINVDNQKMSKSLHNFFTVRDVADLYGYEPIRYFMLTAGYRMPLNYTVDLIESCKNSLERLYTCRENLDFALSKTDFGTDETLKEKAAEARTKFCTAMDDDLNTPDALAAVFDLVKEINTLSAASSKAALETAAAAFDEITGVLGLLYNRKKDEVPAEVTELVEKEIAALAPEKDAAKLAKKTLDNAGIKNDEKGTKALFFISQAQIKALATLAVADDIEDKKAYKEALQKALRKNPSADIALFGRMVADDPSLNFDAAAQVAHSISTHAVQNEYDYFTAVDDCQVEDNAGAGHLGTVEYNSATLYRYATVNVMELERHLGAKKAAEVVRSFGEAFIRSMPTGKQNTFANRTLPDAVYVTIREDQPVNLCGAFERAVRKSAEGYAEPSKSALQAYAQQLYQSFAEAPAKSFTVGTGLEALAPAQPLNTMLDALEEAVKENLTGNEVE